MTIDNFFIDYERLFEVLVSIVVFSFLIERALSVIFETRPFIRWVEASPKIAEIRDGETGEVIQEGKPERPKKSGVKELIAAIVSILFCFWQGFDGITIILQSAATPQFMGLVITGLIIAGGSKASMGLFKDLLGFMSSAERERQEREKNNPDKQQP